MTDMLTHKQGRRRWLLIIVPFLAFYCSLSAGSLELSFNQVFALLLQGPGPEIDQTILWQIRLPRALLAALVGASLSLSGCTFQAVLRNPLADPYLLGVSGGAALGAVIALTFGFQSFIALPVAGFIGALVALLLVYMVARAHTCSSHTLILSGLWSAAWLQPCFCFYSGELRPMQPGRPFSGWQATFPWPTRAGFPGVGYGLQSDFCHSGSWLRTLIY